MTLRRVGKVAIVGVLYHIPAGSHADLEPVDVLETILAPPPSGRLYKLLVETKKASEVSGGAWTLHDPGILRFFAEVASGQEPQAVLDEMLAAIEVVGEKGVTDAEVQRGKEKLLKQRELSSADTSRIAVELSEWAAHGGLAVVFSEPRPFGKSDSCRCPTRGEGVLKNVTIVRSASIFPPTRPSVFRFQSGQTSPK